MDTSLVSHNPEVMSGALCFTGMQTLKINENADHIEFESNYLDNDSVALRAALKTTAQVGACSLSLFRAIYPERFNILGLI